MGFKARRHRWASERPHILFELNPTMWCQICGLRRRGNAYTMDTSAEAEFIVGDKLVPPCEPGRIR